MGLPKTAVAEPKQAVSWQFTFEMYLRLYLLR